MTRAARRRRRRRSPSSRARRRPARRRSTRLADARRGDRSSASTATCTSARRCAPSTAGSSSTSRASRPSRSPSGVLPDSPLARRRRHAALLRLRRPRRSAGPARQRRPTAQQIAYRAARVGERNRDGVPATATPRRPALTPDEQALLDAYEADKAVYEVGLRGPQPARPGCRSRLPRWPGSTSQLSEATADGPTAGERPHELELLVRG